MSERSKLELKICGLAAVRARFQCDADSIKRLFFDYETGRKLGPMCKALAAAKKIYRCVEAAELEKVAGTLHHGGVAAVVSSQPLRAPLAAELKSWASRGESVVMLDRVGNAHNLGAIARTAAFFEVRHLVVPAHPAAAMPNEAAYRVAEGGLEHLAIWRVPDLARFARDLAAVGYDVVGAATRGGKLKVAGPRRRGPVAIVLGNEEHGLAEDVAAACTRLVTIPGGGKVESLNVSVAAAVLIYALVGRD